MRHAHTLQKQKGVLDRSGIILQNPSTWLTAYVAARIQQSEKEAPASANVWNVLSQLSSHVLRDKWRMTWNVFLCDTEIFCSEVHSTDATVCYCRYCRVTVVTGVTVVRLHALTLAFAGMPHCATMRHRWKLVWHLMYFRGTNQCLVKLRLLVQTPPLWFFFLARHDQKFWAPLFAIVESKIPHPVFQAQQIFEPQQGLCRGP